MPPKTIDSEDGKVRRRLSAKAASRQAVDKVKPPKVKATIHLGVEADKRLSVHATMMEMDRSELVEMLITQHLKRFVVSDRGGGEGANSETLEKPNGEIEESMNN